MNYAELAIYVGTLMVLATFFCFRLFWLKKKIRELETLLDQSVEDFVSLQRTLKERDKTINALNKRIDQKDCDTGSLYPWKSLNKPNPKPVYEDAAYDTYSAPSYSDKSSSGLMTRLAVGAVAALVAEEIYEGRTTEPTFEAGGGSFDGGGASDSYSSSSDSTSSYSSSSDSSSSYDSSSSSSDSSSSSSSWD